MCPNTDQKKTSYLDPFHVVIGYSAISTFVSEKTNLDNLSFTSSPIKGQIFAKSKYLSTHPDTP